MSNERKYTEREKVLAQRSAYRSGREYAQLFTAGTADDDARKIYPLPKVTRPREVAEPLHNRVWRIADGQIQTRCTLPGYDQGWHCLANGSAHATSAPAGMLLTPERVRMLADLLANPTEKCEDDG